MANFIYAKAKEKMLGLGSAIDFDADTIKAALVSNAYTPNSATHEFYSDVSAAVLDTPETLGSKTTTGGVFDAADVTFTAVAGGATASYVVIYKDTGVAGTSPLIACFDTITGFPLTTNGGDVTVQWDSGANKILAL
jgi:hypothetical protein